MHYLNVPIAPQLLAESVLFVLNSLNPEEDIDLHLPILNLQMYREREKLLRGRGNCNLAKKWTEFYIMAPFRGYGFHFIAPLTYREGYKYDPHLEVIM